MDRTTRILCAVGLALGLAACGGGDDSTDTASEQPAAAADDTAEPTADESSTDEPVTDEPPQEESVADEPASGDSIAKVTIDGTTYEVDVSLGPAPQCNPDFFAAFLAAGGDADGFFYALLPPPNDPNHSDPPNVSLRISNGDFEWIADPAKQMSGVEEGESQVDSFTVDGNTASGTATFVELNETYAHSGGGDKAQPVTGSFEVTCAG